MIERISLNGKKYVISNNYKEISKFCRENKISISWIRRWVRPSTKFYLYYYLRLWGSYKLRGRKRSEMNKEKTLLELAGFTKPELDKFDKSMNRALVSNTHKGDSWRTCDIVYLKGKLLEEVGEYFTSGNPLELVDIGNICRMLYLREG